MEQRSICRRDGDEITPRGRDPGAESRFDHPLRRAAAIGDRRSGDIPEAIERSALERDDGAGKISTESAPMAAADLSMKPLLIEHLSVEAKPLRAIDRDIRDHAIVVE